MASRIITGFLVFLLAGLIIVTGLSAFARENTTPPLLSAYVFNNGWFDAARADALFKAKSYTEAKTSASSALEMNLTDSRAVRIMALANQAIGDDESTQKWLKSGNNLGWRDSVIQIKLFEYAVKRGDFSAAIDHADSMLRRRVASDELVGIFLIAAQDQKLSENIAQKLSANPSWRPNFFSYKNFQSGESKSAMESILRILAKSENPATRDEIAPYTILLVRAKESARALKLWNDLFPSDIAMLPLSKPGILQWPAGDRFQTPLPADWRFIDNRKAIPIISSDADGKNAVLEIEINDNAIGPLATRMIALPAGALSLRLKQPDGNGISAKDATSIGWSVSCSDGSRKQQMIRQGKSSKWTANIAPGCDAHKIDLEVQNNRGGDKIVLLGQVIVESGS